MGEEKTGRRASDVGRRSSGASILFLVVGMLCAAAPGARGLGVSLTRSPGERALGIDRPAASFLLDRPTGGAGGARWRIEIGHRDLFGIDGVQGASLSFEFDRGNDREIIRIARLASPVGRESEIALGACARAAENFWAGVSLRLESAEIDGCSRSLLLVASPYAVLRVTPEISLVTAVEDVRVTGEELPGANASLRIVAGAERTLCAAVSLTAAREGAFTVGVSSRLLLGREVVLTLGYEESTEAFEGSLSVRVRSAAVDAGATAHPILGVSKAVFVSWGRGW